MAFLDVLGIVLSVLTVIAFLPQYHRVLALRSAAGISLAATCLNTLIAQSQAASIFYLFKESIVLREDTLLISYPPSLQDWTCLVQIIIQWICCLVQFALVTFFHRPPPDPVCIFPPAKIVVLCFWAFHVFLFVFTLDVMPRKGMDGIAWGALTGINMIFATPIFSWCAVASVLLQVQAAVAHSVTEENAISRLGLGIQAVVFMYLAIVWPFRLGPSEEYWRRVTDGTPITRLSRWYQLAGWTCINNGIFALSSAAVLYCAKRPEVKISDVNDERQALLTPALRANSQDERDEY